MTKPYTVIVVLEAQAGKELQLQSALEAVIKPSRSEKGCLEYRLHQSLDNPAQFVFYENWESKEKHLAHMEEAYIKELVVTTEALLAKPFQVILAHELSR